MATAGCIASLSAQEMRQGKPGMWPVSIDYKNAAPAYTGSGIKMINPSGVTVTLYDGSLLKSETDALGQTHVRYQQKYNGIPVENAILLQHVQNNKIKRQNGRWVMNYPAQMATTPSLTPAAAIEKAKQYSGATTFKWELPEEEAFLKKEQRNPNATFYPKADLVYYCGEEDITPAALKLAFKMDIYAHNPVGRSIIFVDAVTGKLLGKREMIHETDAPGTAVTGFSGTQTITSDNTGTHFRLRETGRGNGINTYNLQKTTNYGAAVDFTDADNNWNNVNANLDQYATDAHWGTEKTYDYYLTKHGRNSIDNAGMALNSYVHYSSNYFNAFWDGSRMTYGDGDAAHGNKPLTSLDVCGHEITHGVTERTSQLIYAYESGAMNEGFSDIFGTAIEAFARPGNTDWLIGGDFYTIRSMSNPNAYSHPDTYQGTFWYTGSGDNGGVHINSGVLNHWFYLLVNGGSGTNDHGTPYNVTGIGMDKAAAIAYRLNTVYLTSTSDYYEARTLGIQAAEDLFPGGDEITQTANAWTAVGLYAPTCDVATGLNTINVMDHTATIVWNSIPGATSYTVQYKLNTSTDWYNGGTIPDTTLGLGGLSTNALYDWRVRSNCNGTFSYAQFTTLPPICRVPAALSAIVVDTTATVSWSATIYGTSYTVQYKPAADTGWLTAGNTTGNTFYITGMMQNTLYDWRVKGNCAFDTSAYAQAQFTTNTPICATPTGLSVSYSPGLVTTLKWNAVPGATSYRVDLRWPGGNWGDSELDDVVTDTTISYTGFMSGMNLEWRVKAICPDNNGFYAQSTLSTPCPEATALTATGITGSAATLSWTGGGNSFYGYTVQTKLSTATSWSTWPSTSATTLTVTGLQSGKIYDWRVRRNCLNVNSTFVSGTQFTTLCNTPPAGLKYTTVSANSAVLGWNAVSGAVNYTLQYKKTTATSWTTVSAVATNSYTLTGLTANTGYQFQVQVNCTVGGSGYSSPLSFATYCTSSGNNSQEWIDYFKFGTMERFSGADAGGYFNAAATYSPLNVTIGTTGIAGIVSAAFSGATSRSERYAVYIDFNRNGNFTDAGERVTGPTAMSNNGYYNFAVNIPSTATPGITAIRVVMLRQPTTVTPCLTGSRGETEDYYLNLVAPAGIAPIYNTETVINEQKAEITVKPNPSNGLFTLSIPEHVDAVQYELISSTGTVLQKAPTGKTRTFTLDIRSRPNGLYFLQIYSARGRPELLKLVKQ